MAALALLLLLGGIDHCRQGSLGPTLSSLPLASQAARVDSPEAPPAASPQRKSTEPPIPTPSAKAMRFYRGNNWIWALRQCRELLLPAIVVVSGLSIWMRTIATRAFKHWMLSFLVYLVLYGACRALVLVPWSYLLGFRRLHEYGLSNRTLEKWATDVVLRLSIDLVVAMLFLWIPWFLVRRYPRNWWFPVGMCWLPFTIGSALVFPIWIQPLFNDYSSMADKSLEQEILRLAETAGVSGGRVYVVNKSVDTKAVNAYVAGFWGTKRIVLWDTLIERLSKKEVLFVMAHELGHYRLRHVISSIFVYWALALAGLALVSRLVPPIQERLIRQGWLRSRTDLAGIPVFLFVGHLVYLSLSPLAVCYSRHIEHEADRFALDLTQDSESGVSSFLRLQENNLSNPRPGWFYKLWRGTHPSLAERIEFAHRFPGKSGPSRLE